MGCIVIKKIEWKWFAEEACHSHVSFLIGYQSEIIDFSCSKPYNFPCGTIHPSACTYIRGYNRRNWSIWILDCHFRLNRFISNGMLLIKIKFNVVYVVSEFLENVTMHRNVMKFPSDEDLNGAAAALIRLQDTYNLDTASIARGELNGVKYRLVMWT